jgi:hypothetical protein
MGSLLSGFLLLAATSAVIWWLLPRNGRPVARVMRSGLGSELTGFMLIAGLAFGAALVVASVALRS